MTQGKYLVRPEASLQGLVQILHERPDLRGVLHLSEALDDYVRWSA